MAYRPATRSARATSQVCVCIMSIAWDPFLREARLPVPGRARATYFTDDCRGEAPVSGRTLVVVIDDDQAVCEAMLGFLRASGFTALGFSSAEEFLKSGRVDDTSCVITDVQLTGMSGLGLQSRLVELDCSIPVIVITAFPDTSIRDLVRGIKARRASPVRERRTPALTGCT